MHNVLTFLCLKHNDEYGDDFFSSCALRVLVKKALKRGGSFGNTGKMDLSV